jgi:hypothetical protein
MRFAAQCRFCHPIFEWPRTSEFGLNGYFAVGRVSVPDFASYLNAEKTVRRLVRPIVENEDIV